MATTYKLMSTAVTDGTAYIDLPISGTVIQIAFAVLFTAGAGGIGYVNPELSRVAINQVGINNPRGVLGSATCATSAASTGAQANSQLHTNEPVKSGERLYLNCASAANMATMYAICYITIA